MSSGSGWPVQVLADTQEMSYYDVEPVRNTGPVVTLAGLTLGLLGGMVIGYILHIHVHGF